MIVFVRKKDDVGTLYSGTLEECRQYVDTSDLKEFDTVSIDFDDGRICERIYPIREVVTPYE